MGYEVTGFARSLTIRIYKMAYGSVVSGYPKSYDGKTNIDFLAYYSPLYSSISDDEMAKMSLVDFNARLNDFKAWLETVEYELDFDTASIIEDARIASDDCTTTTTSTSTSSSTTTTTTTTEEPTTTTTTTIIYCESPLCETTLTVGTDGDGNYGFLRGLAGSISPDCGSVNVVGYMDSQGLLGVVLIDYVCDVTLWINGVEYELTYSGYVPEYGGNVYIIPLILNPLYAVGETYHIVICGSECTTTTTTTSECECNSSMTVGSYIQGEYVSVGYGRDGMPPMDFSVMGSISPDCWNVVALCHDTYYTSKSIFLILRNYPCCESIIVEINGVEYTLLFSLQNDIYCSYILSGVDNPFPEEGQICNIAICETSCTTTTTTVEPTTTTTTTVEPTTTTTTTETPTTTTTTTICDGCFEVLEVTFATTTTTSTTSEPTTTTTTTVEPTTTTTTTTP